MGARTSESVYLGLANRISASRSRIDIGYAFPHSSVVILEPLRIASWCKRNRKAGGLTTRGQYDDARPRELHYGFSVLLYLEEHVSVTTYIVVACGVLTNAIVYLSRPRTGALLWMDPGIRSGCAM